MPSFFLMLSPLIGLGNPQFWLRVPPAIFGALAVLLVFIIANRIAGRAAGLVAALIIGMSPAALAFSQEARSYTLEMCLILIALYGLVILAMDIPAASCNWRDKGAAHLGWAALILGSIAALDVLGDGMPWLITANLIGGVLILQSAHRRQLLLNFLFTDLIVALFCAPFYIIMTLSVKADFESSFMWIPPLDVSRLWYNIGSIYLMRVADSVSFRFMDVATPQLAIWSITGGLLAVVAAGIWKMRRNPALLATLVFSCAFLPMLLTVISIWRPVLLPRYILWSAAPFAILGGVGASWLLHMLPRRVQFMTMGFAVILLMVNMLPYYSAETKPRWDIAAQMLAQDVAPGDVVFLDDLGALPVLRMYLPPDVQTVVLNDSAGDLNHALQSQLQGKRVWAVYGKAGQSGAPPGDWDNFYAKISPLGTPRQIQIAGNRIFITLFEPNSHNLTTACTQPPLRPSASAAPTLVCGSG